MQVDSRIVIRAEDGTGTDPGNPGSISLSIRDIHRGDEGDYTCFARNNGGYAMEHNILRVRCKSSPNTRLKPGFPGLCQIKLRPRSDVTGKDNFYTHSELTSEQVGSRQHKLYHLDSNVLTENSITLLLRYINMYITRYMLYYMTGRQTMTIIFDGHCTSQDCKP